MNDPLAAIPVRPADVEVCQDSRGMVYLRRRDPVNRLQRWLRQDYSRRFELDEFGSLFYRLVDGEQSLRAIIARMVEQSGQPRADIERAAVLFTRQLMIQNLLHLKVPA